MDLLRLVVTLLRGCCCLVQGLGKIHVHSSFIYKRLRNYKQKEMYREILSILCLPHRPRPFSPGKQASSAPLFMLDRYNVMANKEEHDRLQGYTLTGSTMENWRLRRGYPAVANGYSRKAQAYRAAPLTQSPPLACLHDGKFFNDADMVMSFINLVEEIRTFHTAKGTTRNSALTSL